MKRKPIYPGTDEVERVKDNAKRPREEEPDFIGGGPNYEKFKGWDPERVLVWLNID